MKCPQCENVECTTRIVVDHTFWYGRPGKGVQLRADVEVGTCPECKEEFMGYKGQDAIDKAIRQHLRTQTVHGIVEALASDEEVAESLDMARKVVRRDKDVCVSPPEVPAYEVIHKLGNALDDCKSLERSLVFLIFRMKNRMGLNDSTVWALEEEAKHVLEDQYPEWLAEFEGRK